MLGLVIRFLYLSDWNLRDITYQLDKVPLVSMFVNLACSEVLKKYLKIIEDGK